MAKKRKGPGRPAKPIPDTPKNIRDALMRAARPKPRRKAKRKAA